MLRMDRHPPKPGRGCNAEARARPSVPAWQGFHGLTTPRPVGPSANIPRGADCGPPRHRERKHDQLDDPYGMSTCFPEGGAPTLDLQLNQRMLDL
jgi:hypothetical protein